MQRSLSLRARFLQCLGGLTVFAFLFEACGGSIDHSRITEVVNEVTVIDPQSRQATPARTDDVFRVPDIMKTGSESRSEMVAEDRTITRIGANTLFSFEREGRTINLRQGSILFQSPTGNGGGTIRTASATASVLGTTIIVVAMRNGGFKLLVLEGTGEVRMPDGKHLILHGGQMVYIAPGSHDAGPVRDFRLSEEVRTGRLVNGFKQPLPSWDKIRKQIRKQEKQIASGKFDEPGTILGGIIDPNTRITQAQTLRLAQGAAQGQTGPANFAAGATVAASGGRSAGGGGGTTTKP